MAYSTAPLLVEHALHVFWFEPVTSTPHPVTFPDAAYLTALVSSHPHYLAASPS